MPSAKKERFSVAGEFTDDDPVGDAPLAIVERPAYFEDQR
jgi:hypothetical protein